VWIYLGLWDHEANLDTQKTKNGYVSECIAKKLKKDLFRSTQSITNGVAMKIAVLPIVWLLILMRKITCHWPWKESMFICWIIQPFHLTLSKIAMLVRKALLSILFQFCCSEFKSFFAQSSHREIKLFIAQCHSNIKRQCVKTLRNPCSSHQNSWDLWMFIPLKMVLPSGELT